MPRTAPPPTPEQQQLLERIAAQRERLLRRHAVPEKDGVDPGDPLVIRLWTFARLHPVLTAAALGLVALSGPARLARWASVVLPLLLQARR